MWASTYSSQSVLYAQNCPAQPLILQNSIISEQPFAQPVKKTPKQAKSKLAYHPHIITAKKWQQGSVKPFDEREHERELSILQTRIRNCKNLAQRKKDHNDPIIYPTYFIREKKRCKDARIDAYFRRIVEGGDKKQYRRNSPGRQIKNRQSAIKKMEEEELTRQSFWRLNKQDHSRFAKSNYPLPPVTHQQTRRRVSNQQRSTLNLPSGDSHSIAAFIIHRRLFLQNDLRILKARLIHNYGDSMDEQWRAAIQIVLRNKPS